MSFKKRFDKRIEEDKKSMYTESDRQFLATLQAMVVERPAEESGGEVRVKTFNGKPLIVGIACAIVAAFTIFLILFFYLSPQFNEPLYLYSNLTWVESDIDELNDDLEKFTVNLDEAKYLVEINKFYDSVSGDNLYYTLDIKNATQDFSLDTKIVVVVNKNYTYTEYPAPDNYTETDFKGYTLRYVQYITPEIGIHVNTVTCTADTKIDSQWVYVTKYQEISLGEGTFLETMESIIQIKE